MTTVTPSGALLEPMGWTAAAFAARFRTPIRVRLGRLAGR
jgi:hypothetical protein